MFYDIVILANLYLLSFSAVSHLMKKGRKCGEFRALCGGEDFVVVWFGNVLQLCEHGLPIRSRKLVSSFCGIVKESFFRGS